MKEGKFPELPPWPRQRSRQLAQLRARHRRLLTELCIDQHLAPVKKNAVAERRALIPDLLLRHVGLQIERVRAKCPRGIGKARGADLQCTAIVARVSRRGEIGEAIFLQHARIGRVGHRRIGTRLYRTAHLPAGKLLRQDGGTLRLRRIGRKSPTYQPAKHHEKGKKPEEFHERNGKHFSSPLDHKARGKVSRSGQTLEPQQVNHAPANGYRRAFHLPVGAIPS